jgi:hypothetical protein
VTYFERIFGVSASDPGYRRSLTEFSFAGNAKVREKDCYIKAYKEK